MIFIKKFTLFSAAFIYIYAVILANSACAIDFSAQLIEKDNGVLRTGKVYMSAQKSRFEMDDTPEISISRADLKVSWSIFPRLGVYLEETFNGAIPVNVDNNIKPRKTEQMNVEELGYETVDTFRLKKVLVTIKYKSGLEDKYYEWYRSDFPLPVKQESLNGLYGFEYRKIKYSLQDPNTFNRPRKYKKVTFEEFEELQKKYDEKHKKREKNTNKATSIDVDQ